MHRRIAVLVLVLTAGLVVLPPTASFAASAMLRSPEDGVVTGPTELVVRVERDQLEVLDAIDLSLRRGEQPVPGSRPVRACDGWQACSEDRSRDVALAFDPATGAPFLPGEAARILPNGAYDLRVTTRFQDRSEDHALRLVLSVPPSPPEGVAATADGDRVTLRWRSAPEPDVVGYRIERAAEGRWRDLATVAAGTSTFQDAPGPGTYRYRIVSLRPDGRDGRLEAPSSTVTATLEAPGRNDPPAGAEVPPDEATGDDADLGAGDDVVGGGGGAGRDGEVDDAGPTAAERDEVGAATRTRSGLRRAAAAPAGGGNRASIPDLPSGDAPDVPDTLDYGTTEVIRPDRSTDEVVLSVRGGASDGLGGLDAPRAAVPLAGGLLLTALGLHLWRWLRIAGR